MDDITDFEVIGADAFDGLPACTPRPRNPAIWDPVLDALELGDAVRMPCRDDEDVHHKALDLARRARARGIRIEVRSGADFVAARKKDAGTMTSPIPTGTRLRRSKHEEW